MTVPVSTVTTNKTGMCVSELLYPDYRNYVDTRVVVNNAMTALLAGSRLGAHTLQLTSGSQRTLSELFPAVEHINRFNLRSDVARSLLNNADHHLASVALPYALATHEDFVMASINLLRNEGISIQAGGKPIKAWNMHTALFDSAQHPRPTDWLESFDLLREVRNCLAHAGGKAQTRLIDHIAAMGNASVTGWQRLNRQHPNDVIQAGTVKLIAEHIFTAFAVTKHLGREINAALTAAIPGESWARIAVEDFHSTTSKLKNSSAWRRGLVGYARVNYGKAKITESEIEKAARSLNYWTLSRWE
ncbi:hypothetical protein SCMC78_35140 [Streptomyces sp. CMC78]|uniref:RiboL-PSP-HEPN domain-containing protein n=1 Tax=Streptomyces sp. CMC78 TaxID=3231512 RepID=A0AB33KMF1_9ACTN